MDNTTPKKEVPQPCTRCRAGLYKREYYTPTSFKFTCDACGYEEIRYIQLPLGTIQGKNGKRKNL